MFFATRGQRLFGGACWNSNPGPLDSQPDAMTTRPYWLPFVAQLKK